ncbi:hypothetical protein RYH80_03625 [Halobaculum sp. MBLA0147]|uniref:hypothetical protein n=1 Tax=Halobaculum sp. MBLA0147 TaxID=3079934 RepID=UPI003524393E
MTRDDTPSADLDAAEFRCDHCGERFGRERGVRPAPFGDLDTTRWQRFDCPACGRRGETVFVARDAVK